MKTFSDWLPIIFAIAEAIQILVLYAFRSSIRIAILEALQSISDKYATKDDVKKVEQQIDLAGRVDRGFNRTFELIGGGQR